MNVTAVRVEELDQRIIAYDLDLAGRDDPPRATGPSFDDSELSVVRSTTMFSRRDLLAVSAMGAAMTVSAANAGSFGNPDEPPEGAINAKNPASVTDPGPQDPAIRDQLQSAFSPPPTDVGGRPQIWSSFNTVQRPRPERRLGAASDPGGLRNFHNHLRRQYATDGRRHPRVALASGGRVGVHDLRSLPGDRDRSDGPPLCCRRQGWRYLVFSCRLSAFAAGPRTGRLRICYLLR